MFMKRYLIIPTLFLLIVVSSLVSDEYINSYYADYARYLELADMAESPVMSYHSYSSYDWDYSAGPWRDRQEKRVYDLFNDSLSLTVSDTTAFTSWNSDFARTAFNDGALWQGRYFNNNIKTGLELQSSYVSLNLLPEFTYSQNGSFDTVAPAMTSNQTDEYSYFYWGIDFPQRMGDDSFSSFSWGQSEVRTSYGPVTLGFSHENMKWGPAVYNPLIMSANAEGFHHIDFGLTKTETRAGTFEFRGVYGRLEESDHFNENSDDDYTLFSGYTFAWAPPWFPNFSLGLNRSLIVNWDDISSESLQKLYNPIISSNAYAYDATDQRASIWMDWKLINSGVRFYLELFKEDHNRVFKKVLLYPEHTLGFTFGGEQAFPLTENRGILVDAEVTWLQVSRTYDLKYRDGGTYYIHGYVYHGYTNRGQLLGAPCGPGADAQNFAVTWFDRWGLAKFHASRINKNKDYVYSRDLSTYYQDVELSGGFSALYFLTQNISAGADFTYTYNYDRNYEYKTNQTNYYISADITYRY